MYHSIRNGFGCTRWNSKVTWVMSNLVLVHLEIVLVSVQDRCTVCAKHTTGLEIILDAPDNTPRWQSSSWCLIQFIWYCANLDARLVHGLHQTYHRLRNRFGHTGWYSLVTRLKWMLDSVCLDKVLILTQDRCTVCAERTTGSEIILDAPNGTPRRQGSSGSSIQTVQR
jgi:hypothetical protein